MNKAIKVTLLLFSIGILSFCQNNEQKTQKGFINYEAIVKIPQPNGFVSDFEGLFSITQKHELDSIIKDFKLKTTNEIAIVTIENVKPYQNLQDFTTDLLNYWGVGLRDKNNGLIITISKSMKSIWIGTGYGTEKVLTNNVLQNIIDTQMVPFFKSDEIYKGTKKGLLECIDNWD